MVLRAKLKRQRCKVMLMFMWFPSLSLFDENPKNSYTFKLGDGKWLFCLVDYNIGSLAVKGQLISKCPFGVIVWTKIPTKLFLDFCPEFFCSFLGASWKLFGASCRLPWLWYYILSPHEAQKASRNPLGRYKKFQGRIPEIFLLVFWMKLIFYKDILKLTDL